MVIEWPPGPLICIAMDLGQRWILDMGLPGPDAGAGGRHLLLPVGGDVPAAVERLKTGIGRPLDPGAAWQAPALLDLTPEPQDTTPDRWEDNIGNPVTYLSDAERALLVGGTPAARAGGAVAAVGARHLPGLRPARGRDVPPPHLTSRSRSRNSKSALIERTRPAPHAS